MQPAVLNIREKMIRMGPHPKDGNMYRGFFCKYEILNDTVAIKCSTFLLTLTTQNSHIEHCTHTWESTDIKVQNVFNV